MNKQSKDELPTDKHRKVKKHVTFATSPRMSTHLVAFALGEFNHIEVNSFHVPIRVYTTPDRDVEDGRYAIEILSRALAFYEKQFGAKYPLPKLDLLGVAAHNGAMENWGLIIFQDRALLTNKTVTSAAAKLQITNTILHEEAHLWFGELVTCSWWESLCLNESFTTWVSRYGVNSFNPEWQVWNRFGGGAFEEALGLDSLRASHPIEVPVATSGEIDQIFDAISYQKGSSVLRMLAAYLGEYVFVEGVKRYIAAHAYGNTITDDLWAGLSDASGEDVAALMRPWTKNVGYHIVTVTEDERTKIVTIRQNRYLRTGDAKPEDDTVLWPVFLNLKTNYIVNNRIVLTGREGHFLAPSLETFKLNTDHTAVYRTLYTPRRLMKLALDGRQGNLSVADRAGLVADSAALATSGHQSSALTFYFIREMLEGSSFFVWKQIVAWFNDLNRAWLHHDNRDMKDALKSAARHFLAGKAHELGWDFSSDTDTHGDAAADDGIPLINDQFKPLMFGAAAGAGDRKAIDAAKDLFTAYTSGDHSVLNVNLRASVFATAISQGANAEYDAGLGYARGPLCQRSLDLLNDVQVPFAHLRPLAAALSTHVDGSRGLLDMMTDDEAWARLMKRVPPGIGSMDSLLPTMLGGLSTYEQADRVEMAFKGRDVRGLEKVLAQGVEEITVRAGWVRRSGREVEGWLREEGYLRRKKGRRG